MGQRLPGKKLGLLLGTNACWGPNRRVMMNHGNARLVDAVRGQVESARLCVPILPRHDKMSHEMQFREDEVTCLPPLRSTRESQVHFYETVRTLRKFASEVDVLFVRLPFQVPRALLKLGKPKLLHLAGDPEEVLKASNDYRGIWNWLANYYARHSIAVFRKLVREPHTRVASNGKELWDKLGCRDGRIVVSSCLYEREMQPRTDHQLHDPPRLLFVGYLRPEKGVHTLLGAFHRLRSQRPLKLTIVGGSDRITRAEQDIRDSIAASPYVGDIELAGMIDFGPPLFELYREHDVCVLPSLSEGTPRTLVEARAFGCPVVATRVGGIPTSVTDSEDGLLVPPGDDVALAEAIGRMLDDHALRTRLIDEGVRRSHHRTLESFAEEIVSELEALVASAEPRAAQAVGR
ncbi:MAG: glycosyltransferase family 4 protein [Pirellulales bacterium]|nr:glycosyltransferase family 4 protein [Pirellulales bacterium]